MISYTTWFKRNKQETNEWAKKMRPLPIKNRIGTSKWGCRISKKNWWFLGENKSWNLPKIRNSDFCSDILDEPNRKELPTLLGGWLTTDVGAFFSHVEKRALLAFRVISREIIDRCADTLYAKRLHTHTNWYTRFGRCVFSLGLWTARAFAFCTGKLLKISGNIPEDVVCGQRKTYEKRSPTPR